MQKILTFLDYTAGILIAIFCLGQLLQIFGLNIWEFSLNEYAGLNPEKIKTHSNKNLII